MFQPRFLAVAMTVRRVAKVLAPWEYRDTLLFFCLCCAVPMSRIARVVVPGIAHHVTQRGNRRERVLFSDEDYEFYQRLIAAPPRRQVWHRGVGLVHSIAANIPLDK